MHYTIEQNSFGRFLLADRDLISSHIREGRGWDADLLPIVDAAANPNGTAIDAGAYSGFFSIQMARRFRRVLAFEPQPHIFYNLCANVFLNGFSNIEPFNKALYNHAGFMQVARRSLQDVDVPMNELGIDYSAFDNHGAVAFEPINSGEGIPCVTVDSLAVDNLALLVTDCQGADFRILRGAKETIQRCRPIVMFESERNLERERGISRQLYKLFFSDLNYKMSAVRGHINDPQTEYLAVPIERRQQFARFLGGG